MRRFPRPGSCCGAAPPACCCSEDSRRSAQALEGNANCCSCPFEGLFIRCLIQRRTVIVVCVGQVPKGTRTRSRSTDSGSSSFVAWKPMQSSLCFFGAWKVFVLALELSPPPSNPVWGLATHLSQAVPLFCCLSWPDLAWLELAWLFLFFAPLRRQLLLCNCNFQGYA